MGAKFYSYSAGGPTPKFSPYHVWKAYRIVSEKGPIGRKALSNELKIGEGSTRTILDTMIREGSAENTNRGAVLTERGKDKLSDSGIHLEEVNLDGLTVSKYNCAVLIKGTASKITAGSEQRDEAVRAGAIGATTLVCKNGRLLFPGDDKYPDQKVVAPLRGVFAVEDDDVVIVGSALTREAAERGAVSAALCMSEKSGLTWHEGASLISQDTEAEDLKAIALAIHELVGRLPLTMRSKNQYGVRCEDGEIIDGNYTGPVLEESLRKNQIIRKISPTGPYRGVPIVAVPILRKKEALAVIGVVDISKGAVFEILNRIRKERL
jgi:predicted transcriptional regulator